MLSKLPCCEDCAESHLIEENQYRVGSEKYYEFFQEKRQAYRKGELEFLVSIKNLWKVTLVSSHGTKEILYH